MWQRRSWFSLKGKAGIPGQTEGRPATSIGPRVPPVGSLQQRDLRRLAFIRHARELGFEIDAIRALLALQDQPGQSCAAADQIARARLTEVEQRIARLTALKAELERMITG